MLNHEKMIMTGETMYNMGSWRN